MTRRLGIEGHDFADVMARMMECLIRSHGVQILPSAAIAPAAPTMGMTTAPFPSRYEILAPRDVASVTGTVAPASAVGCLDDMFVDKPGATLEPATV